MLKKLFGRLGKKNINENDQFESRSKVEYSIGDLIGGEYLIKDVFEGGMGNVYLVEDREVDFQYVLKSYKAIDPSSSMQFLKEARTWVDIGIHPNILQAFWAREIDNKVFVAAEYVQKDEENRNSLADHIETKSVTPHSVIRWMAEFCYGMEHAHKMGLKVHRDIKPGNILIDNGVLKICDFGLAKAKEQLSMFDKPEHSADNNVTDLMSETANGTVTGTPPYMAPEQFLGSEYTDTRSDIYSFGITMWEAMTGTLPLIGHSLAEFARLHAEVEVPEFDHPIWPILRKCLEKSPDNRYQNFSLLLQDVQNLASRHKLPIPPQPTELDPALEGLYLKAQSYVTLGNPNKALESIVEYLDQRPGDYWAWTEKGRILLENNDLNEALSATERSLEVFSNNSTALNNLGIIQRRLGNIGKSINAFEDAIKLDQANTGAILNLSISFMTARKHEEAVSYLEKAIEINPHKASIWNNLGVVYLDLGEDGKAKAAFEKALEINPNLEQAKDGLDTIKALEEEPDVFLKSGMISKAKSILIKRTKLLNKADDWHNLGCIYLDEKGFDDAIHCFEKVTEISPDDFAFNQLVRLNLNRNELEKALTHAEVWHQRGKDKTSSAASKAQILDYLGRYEEAVDFLTEILKKYFKTHVLWFVLSEIHERNKNYSQALSSAKFCLRILKSIIQASKDNKDIMENKIGIEQKIKRLEQMNQS